MKQCRRFLRVLAKKKLTLEFLRRNLNQHTETSIVNYLFAHILSSLPGHLSFSKLLKITRFFGGGSFSHSALLRPLIRNIKGAWKWRYLDSIFWRTIKKSAILEILKETNKMLRILNRKIVRNTEGNRYKYIEIIKFGVVKDLLDEISLSERLFIRINYRFYSNKNGPRIRTALEWKAHGVRIAKS